MIGTCKLCQQIILCPPAAAWIDVEERRRADYAALVNAMRLHLWNQHRSDIEGINLVVSEMVLFTSGLLLNCEDSEFDARQTEHRARLVDTLSKLSVVTVAVPNTAEKDEPCPK